ncbi:hypothetical protein HPP92_012535 [Vanilla planifolia]|uniref:BHLH domain-containing protein n=1 Tax=Vanilla planifolia TaxID=51239 RepID=A0A835QQN8_VANPL|nr:hypothetical protein HPP92_012535 [Vanilla planifolia]
MKLMIEGLRPLVGAINAWDYCILWKLSHDNRALEWTDCCCGGRNRGGTHRYAPNSDEPCRDASFRHPKTMTCDELTGFPTSIPLEYPSMAHFPFSTRYRTQALISNQPLWLTDHQLQDSHGSPEKDDEAKTRVLIPIHGGMVELFSWKHMEEEQQSIEFVMAQCNPCPFEPMLPLAGDAGYSELPACDYLPAEQQISLQWPLSGDSHMRLYGSPLDLISGKPLGMDRMVDDLAAFQPAAIESSVTTREAEKEPAKPEGITDSGMEGSDQGEDDDDPRPTGRGGKPHHSKNLVAERKRRKKLNERLYALRSMVPNITKMDRASILGDAIEYVIELQKQIKELQDELEEGGTDESAKQMGNNNGSGNNNLDAENEDRGPQMEPHVEVRQVEGGEFFVKVLCEQRAGGFAKLLEAMGALGLEVTNANVTTFKTLVLHAFRLEINTKRDTEVVQAEQVRNSLLEVTRDAGGEWPEMVAGDYHHRHHLHYLCTN